MTENLEALAAVASVGSMTRAATELRVTQSAVPKRIANLEAELEVELVEPDGRGVRLTPAASALLARVRPLLADLRAALSGTSTEATGEISLGVAESVLASWGPRLLRAAQRKVPGVRLRLAAHRSPVVIDHVRSGEFQLALCAGKQEAVADLSGRAIGSEEMVIVPSGLRALSVRRGRVIPIVTIERGSSTWPDIRPQVARLRRERGVELRVEQTLQTFSAIVQLSREGFGHGLVPIGIARSMAIPVAKLVRLPRAPVVRHLSVYGRPANFSRPLCAAFVDALCGALPALGAGVRGAS